MALEMQKRGGGERSLSPPPPASQLSLYLGLSPFSLLAPLSSISPLALIAASVLLRFSRHRKTLTAGEKFILRAQTREPRLSCSHSPNLLNPKI
uniref:Uncharacterized protein n=1 Tax=Knipowitschia caucasica TaxID=637954 RepID=A0AAV2KWM3_KNICA